MSDILRCPGASKNLTGLCTPHTIILDDPNFVVCFSLLSESIRIWFRNKRSIAYIHALYILFFHMLRMWKSFVGEYPLREITRMWISIPNIFRLFKSFTDGSRVMCISIEWSMQTIKVLSAYPDINSCHLVYNANRVKLILTKIDGLKFVCRSNQRVMIDNSKYAI